MRPERLRRAYARLLRLFLLPPITLALFVYLLSLLLLSSCVPTRLCRSYTDLIKQRCCFVFVCLIGRDTRLDSLCAFLRKVKCEYGHGRCDRNRAVDGFQLARSCESLQARECFANVMGAHRTLQNSLVFGHAILISLSGGAVATILEVQ